MLGDNLRSMSQPDAWQIQAARYSLLSDVVLLIAQTPDLKRMLSGAINKIKWVLDFERCTLALLNDDAQSYQVQTLLETRRTVPSVTKAQISLTQGIPGEVIQSQKVRLIADLSAARGDLPPLADPALAEGTLATVLALPLQAYGRVLGALTFSTVRSNGFDDEDLKVAQTFATHLALGIDRWQQTQNLEQANEAVRQQNEYLAALHETALGLMGRLDLNDLLEALVTRAGHLLATPHGYIYLTEPEGTAIERKVGVGVFSQSIGNRLQPGEGLAGKVWQSGQPLVVDDYDAWPDRSSQFGFAIIRAIMGAPLKFGPEIAGVIGIAYGVESKRVFGKAEVELLNRFAELASIALDNARLYTEAREAHLTTEAANHELSQALDHLKATQNQLVEAEKMAALGGLVAGVAHEINTPVGVGVTAASLLEEKTAGLLEIYQSGQMKRSDLEKYLHTAGQSSQMILQNLQRAAELIQSFKQVAVDQSSEERREFRVKAYLEEILRSLHPKLKRTHLTLHINAGDDLILDSYPGAFSQVVTNLVMNSLLHAYEPDDTGQLTFDFKQDSQRLIFEYRDDGKGIPQENLSKIFDPFFTTKRGQGGSGLGLHIIYNLVTQKLGGTIQCQSQVGVGTTFVIELPLYSAKPTTQHQPGA